MVHTCSSDVLVYWTYISYVTPPPPFRVAEPPPPPRPTYVIQLRSCYMLPNSCGFLIICHPPPTHSTAVGGLLLCDGPVPFSTRCTYDIVDCKHTSTTFLTLPIPFHFLTSNSQQLHTRYILAYIPNSPFLSPISYPILHLVTFNILPNPRPLISFNLIGFSLIRSQIIVVSTENR
jgi:hypothetical protein